MLRLYMTAVYCSEGCFRVTDHAAAARRPQLLACHKNGEHCGCEFLCLACIRRVLCRWRQDGWPSLALGHSTEAAARSCSAPPAPTALPSRFMHVSDTHSPSTLASCPTPSAPIAFRRRLRYERVGHRARAVASRCKPGHARIAQGVAVQVQARQRPRLHEPCRQKTNAFTADGVAAKVDGGEPPAVPEHRRQAARAFGADIIAADVEVGKCLTVAEHCRQLLHSRILNQVAIQVQVGERPAPAQRCREPARPFGPDRVTAKVHVNQPIQWHCTSAAASRPAPAAPMALPYKFR